eukprot:12930811-Prorocentrum_lima.AAC.1
MDHSTVGVTSLGTTLQLLALIDPTIAPTFFLAYPIYAAGSSACVGKTREEASTTDIQRYHQQCLVDLRRINCRNYVTLQW